MSRKLVKINIAILIAEFLAHLIVGLTIKNSTVNRPVLTLAAGIGIWASIAFFVAALTGLILFTTKKDNLFFVMTQIRFLATFAVLAISAFVMLFIAIAHGIGGGNEGLMWYEWLITIFMFVLPIAVPIIDTVAAFFRRKEDLQRLSEQNHPYYNRLKGAATAKPIVLIVESILSFIAMMFMLLLILGL